MKAIVYIDEAAAREALTRMDESAGYPFDGQDIGAGVHAPPEQSRTLRSVDPIKHPTMDVWALPVDFAQEDVEKFATEDVRAISVASELSADWVALPDGKVEGTIPVVDPPKPAPLPVEPVTPVEPAPIDVKGSPVGDPPP